MQSRPRPQRGFTLIEMLVAMAVLALLLAVAMPNYLVSVERAREAALRENLRVMRVSIDQFSADRGRFPRALAELVEAGYLKAIPVDPLTGSAQTWVVSAPGADIDPAASGGVADVHSGAPGSHGW